MDDDSRQGAVLTAVIHNVAETGSTNADMLAMAAAGATEGVWLRAERQTAGRGRHGRDWASPLGNLYASTLVRLAPGDPPAATLALVAAVALHQSVAACLPADAPPAQIKWPNDLLIAGAKLAGILLERAGEAVVIGIGVNLAQSPSGLARPATSLAAQGACVAPEDFLEMVREELAAGIARWRRDGLSPVRDRWLAAAHPAGTALSVHLPGDVPLEGWFGGLDASGALILRLADGATRVIHAGDVFLL